MRSCTLSLVLVIGVFVSVNGDMYLHNPRGSNNRLNEASANRANANRAFDSQVGKNQFIKIEKLQVLNIVFMDEVQRILQIDSKCRLFVLVYK